MKPTNTKSIRAFGLLGIAAALLVGTGEFLIHFSPTGYEGAAEYLYLANVPAERLTLGHFLLVAGLPLYFAGYWFIYHCLNKSRWAAAVLITAVVSFSTGGIWVSSRAMLARIVQVRLQPGGEQFAEQLLAFYDGHYEILVQVLRILILLLSVFWVIAILKTKTRFPKWMAIFSPIVLLIVIFLSYAIFPSFGKYLVPTAMNAAHLVFFGLAFLVYKRSSGGNG